MFFYWKLDCVVTTTTLKLNCVLFCLLMKLCPLTANRNWLPKSQWQNLHKLLQTHCQVWDSFGCEMPFEFGKSDSWGWIHFKQHANCVGDSDFWKILPCEKNRRITLTLSTTSNFMCIANVIHSKETAIFDARLTLIFHWIDLLLFFGCCFGTFARWEPRTTM